MKLFQRKDNGCFSIEPQNVTNPFNGFIFFLNLYSHKTITNFPIT